MFGHVAHQTAPSTTWSTGPVPEAPPIDRLAPQARRPFWSVMIPVYNPTEILRDEIIGQMADVRDWGCRFVTPLPSVTLYD